MGVINKLLGRLKLYSDPAVTTQTTTVIQSDTTNSSIALVPNGTGAIIASVPDGTTTGGNARGQYAIDLQTYRTNANQVASGIFNVILGGSRHRTLGEGSVIAGGDSNIASNNGAVVSGGYNHTSSGQYSTVSGGFGNNATSNYSTVSGGQSNTASTNTHATVVGGQSNTSSGNNSVGGGFTNTASGQYSVALGNNNIASGNGCISLGSSNTSRFSTSVSIGNSNIGNNNRTYAFGDSNTIPTGDSVCIGASNNTTGGTNNLYAFGNGNALSSGTNSFAFGYQNGISTGTGMALGFSGNVTAPYATSMGQWSRAYLYGQVSMANGLLGGSQNAQQSLLTAYNSTALLTGGTQVLSLDGTGITNLIIPYGNNRAWNVQIDTIAVVTAITGTATGVTVGDCYRETKQLLFKRIGGTSSIVGTVDTTAIKSDTSMSACAMTITAGASQEMALTFTAPTFTGGGSVTCRVVSKVSLVEVAY